MTAKTPNSISTLASDLSHLPDTDAIGQLGPIVDFFQEKLVRVTTIEGLTHIHSKAFEIHRSLAFHHRNNVSSISLLPPEQVFTSSAGLKVTLLQNYFIEAYMVLIKAVDATLIAAWRNDRILKEEPVLLRNEDPILQFMQLCVQAKAPKL